MRDRVGINMSSCLLDTGPPRTDRRPGCALAPRFSSTVEIFGPSDDGGFARPLIDPVDLVAGGLPGR